MTNGSLRLRIFAGPNGSGKSTIINAIRAYRINDNPVDFGLYINADDIAAQLRTATFTFDDYEINPSSGEFKSVCLNSGLIQPGFDQEKFSKSFQLRSNKVILTDADADERLAQIIADYLRKKLLQERKKYSFETVFSHASKLEIMKHAVAAGYKVYLYFVSTESPEINEFRVASRVNQGGHDVPTNKIVDRYYRSLDLLFDAAQLTYQTFFFDNSVDISAGETFRPFAHFKNVHGEKKWGELDYERVPQWFIKYYSDKVAVQ